MTARRVQFGVRLLLLATVAVSLTGCLKGKTPSTDTTGTSTTGTTDGTQTDGTSATPTVSDLTSLAPSGFDSELNAHYALAKTAAAAWHSDAVVTYVSVSLGTSLKPEQGNEVYVFGSASDLDNWFTFSYSEPKNKSVRAIIPKADYLGDKLTPVNVSYWSMNFVQALQLAEQNGGATFRTANPNPQITVYLSNRTPRGWLWWTVQYEAASGQTQTLLINPFLGGVVDEQGTQLVPDRATSSSSTTGSTTTTTQ